MTSNFRRIANELRFFREDPPTGCTGGPIDDNIYEWLCTVSGPSQSLYAQRQFHFVVNFPPNYPFEAPNITLEDDICHPNLQKGQVEIQSIAEWSPVQTVAHVLNEILQLLIEPNIERELVVNAEAGRVFKEDPKAFAEMAKQGA